MGMFRCRRGPTAATRRPRRRRRSPGCARWRGGRSPPASRDLAPRAEPPPVAPPDDAPSIPGYDAPEWGGVGAADVSLEVLKEGAIVDVVRCAGRARLAFGRVPGNDVVLEHPSASRLHAVLQFKRDSDEMFCTTREHTRRS